MRKLEAPYYKEKRSKDLITWTAAGEKKSMKKKIKSKKHRKTPKTKSPKQIIGSPVRMGSPKMKRSQIKSLSPRKMMQYELEEEPIITRHY